MELLEISAENSKATGVLFSPSGVLELKGVSCEEDPKPFYQRLKDWVQEYLHQPAVRTEFSVRLKYFNTSSARCLFELMEQLTALSKTGKELVIRWYYEEGDEDMEDSVKMFEELIHHKIELIPVGTY